MTENATTETMLAACAAYTEWAWTIEGITPAEKLVLLSLARRCDHAGMSYPSFGRLAEEANTPDPEIRNILESLDRKEIIHWISDEHMTQLRKPDSFMRSTPEYGGYDRAEAPK